MDPLSAMAILEGIVDSIDIIHKIFNAVQELRENFRAVDGFVLFLGVLREQIVAVKQMGRVVPESTSFILQAIGAEMQRVGKTATAFQNRHPLRRAFFAESTAKELKESRVVLNEHWVLYLASLSTDRHALRSARDFAAQPVASATWRQAGLSEHGEHLYSALLALCTPHTSAQQAARHIKALRDPKNRVADVSDEQEKHISEMLSEIQQQLPVPTAAFPPDASARVANQISEMRAAMESSVAEGMEAMSSQLAALNVAAEQHACATGKILSKLDGIEAGLHAVAYGDAVPGALPAWHREIVGEFYAAVEQQHRWIIDSQIMACPGLGMPFEREGPATPTLVPGCNCTVAYSAARVYRKDGRCGVCNSAVLRDGELRADRVALQILDDLEAGRLPPIRKFEMREFREDNDEVRRVGGEGFVRFGMLRGKPVAVKTVEFAARNANVRQRRCRKHVLLNSICTQVSAAQASPHVCSVLGLCWEDNCAHIAMPRLSSTLEEYVQTHTPRGMPLHVALDLSVQLLRAVAAVHGKHILHCDMNPTNILLDDDLKPWLIDFGLSHVSQGKLETRTSMGATLLYAAPEQVEGRVNKATDIYSLGRTLIFAATGVKPLRVPGDVVQNLPEHPQQFAEVLRKMTGNQTQRREIVLMDVLAELQSLSRRYGPIPVSSPVFHLFTNAPK